MNQAKKLHPAVAALVVIVLIGIVASAAIVINNAKDGTPGSTSQDVATHDHDRHTHGTTDTVSAPKSTDTSTYEDGTYNATGSYISPGGKESIELSVTVKDGAIVETSMKNRATDGEAEEYQQLFADHYKSLIVGKKLSEVASLSRVAGSSLTSSGFNDALDQIKNDARA